MDITFNCGWCGQRIAVDESAAGISTECPKCGQPITVPSHEIPRPEPSATKQCHYCAETIKAEAKICRFCGYDLVTGKPPTRSGETTPHKARNEEEINTDQSVGEGAMICPNPNCGYRGNPRQEPKGNVLYGIVLCVLCLLPGIIYFIVQSGYNYVCPKCGVIWRKDLIA